MVKLPVVLACTMQNIFWIPLTGLFGLVIWKIVLPIFCRRRNSLRLADGVASPTRHWLLGHMAQYPPTQDGILNSARRAFRYPAMSMNWFGPTEAALECYHPDTVKAILSNDLPKATFAYKFLRPWVGDSILLASGDEWKRKRKLLDIAFKTPVLKSYTPVFNDCVKIMINNWEKRTSATIELLESVGLMSLDAFLRCCMSCNINPQNERRGMSSYAKAIRGLNSMIMQRIFRFHLWSDTLFRRSELGKKFYDACKLVHENAEMMIRKKKEYLSNRANNNIKPGDESPVFLDILLEAKDGDGNGLSELEVRHEVDTFMFAGHDTTSSGIAWTLYNLAKHGDVQQKCFEELKTSRTETGDTITWQQLQNLPYLTMCVKESLRLFPPVTGVGRCPHHPLTIRHRFDSATKTVPPESTVNIRIFDLHRHPEIWPDPEVYDPERFNPENASQRPPFSYLPFSAGKRNCIGQNFAMTLIKVAVGRVLQRYNLYLDEGTPEPIMKPEIVLGAEKGIHIKIKKRHSD